LAWNYGMMGGCEYYSLGCTDSLAENYDPLADMDDGSCTYDTCDDALAWNYGMIGECEFYDWGYY